MSEVVDIISATAGVGSFVLAALSMPGGYLHRRAIARKVDRDAAPDTRPPAAIDAPSYRVDPRYPHPPAPRPPFTVPTPLGPVPGPPPAQPAPRLRVSQIFPYSGMAGAVTAALAAAALRGSAQWLIAALALLAISVVYFVRALSKPDDLSMIQTRAAIGGTLAGISLSFALVALGDVSHVSVRKGFIGAAVIVSLMVIWIVIDRARHR